MSETCFSFGEERGRHQLHGAPREQTIERSRAATPRDAVKLVYQVHRITSQESPCEKVIAGVLTETSAFISH